MKTNAKEKDELILKKMDEEFEKDEQFKKMGSKANDLNEDALVTAFNTILIKKIDKKLQERGSKLSMFKLIHSSSKIPNITEDIKELPEVEHEVYMEWLGFDPLEEVEEKKRRLPPTKYEEVKKLLYIPINPDFYNIVPYVIPYRLTENSLVHKEILKDNSLALKYKIESRGKSIIFNFLIPSEVLGRIKEKDIPTVGVNMRKSLYGALAFAFVQNSISPNFKRSELLEFIGENPQKTRKLYSDLEKGLLTWAYGTYTIISGDKVSEVGHIVNKLKLAKERGDRTLVEFNPEVVKPLLRSQMDTETLRYISYPTDLLKVKPKEMKSYVRNFCESLLKKQGMGRQVYPKFVRNIMIQDFGIPSKKLRKLSNKQIEDILMKGIKEAKGRGFLEDYKVTEESQKKALYNIRKWKIKLIIPSKPEDDL